MFVIAIAFCICILVYVITRKRRLTLTKTILTPVQKGILTANVRYYHNLDDANKEIFEDKVEQFLDDVHIEGVGLKINDTDRMLIASSAVIPIFAFKEWTYRNVTNVLLYPDTFDKDFQFDGDDNRNIMGMVGSGYMNGQMILSRKALLKGFSANAGDENTGIHEFVHLLDKTDGATDGVPESFLEHQYVIPWIKMMHQQIHKINEGRSDINIYGGTNEAEFFAVVSEYFFEKPDQFQNKHPELYDMLTHVFGQKPARS